jgi:hypothetical protein
MSSESEQFPHRQNSNGTYDSICPKCFRTIDTRYVEGNLAAEERVHICGQEHLLRRDKFDTQNCADSAFGETHIAPDQNHGCQEREGA